MFGGFSQTLNANIWHKTSKVAPRKLASLPILFDFSKELHVLNFCLQFSKFSRTFSSLTSLLNLHQVINQVEVIDQEQVGLV
jgi:hypothetical protein